MRWLRLLIDTKFKEVLIKSKNQTFVTPPFNNSLTTKLENDISHNHQDNTGGGGAFNNIHRTDACKACDQSLSLLPVGVHSSTGFCV